MSSDGKIAAEYRDWLPQRFWASASHCVACSSNYPCPIKGGAGQLPCDVQLRPRRESLAQSKHAHRPRGTNSIQPFRSWNKINAAQW